MTQGRIIVPEEYKPMIAQSSSAQGFMGLSAGKSLFTSSEAMKAYACFGHEKFRSFTFLIADLPKRYNLMALEGIDEVRATYRTAIIGLDMRRLLKKITGNYKNVTVRNWIDFSDNEDYQKNLALLNNAYQSDNGFSFECNSIVWGFLSLPKNLERSQRLGNSLEDRVKICKSYVLDEFAMLLAVPKILGEDVCEIYPGKNDLQEKLQRGEFSFCDELIINPQRKFMEAYYEPPHS